MAFQLTSPTIADGEPIPDRHAWEGGNRSPALEWTDPPDGTRGYLLVVDDPDAPAGVFQHWIVAGIPGTSDSLPEAVEASEPIRFGLNDFGSKDYGGPRPPRGHGAHRYRFRLAALDTDALDLGDGFTADEAWAAAQPHFLSEAVLTGLYRRD